MKNTYLQREIPLKATSSWPFSSKRASASVAVLKSRTRITPTMHSHFRPGTMAFTPAEPEPIMFWPMMSAPASPKPSASREPSLGALVSFKKPQRDLKTCNFRR